MPVPASTDYTIAAPEPLSARRGSRQTRAGVSAPGSRRGHAPIARTERGPLGPRFELVLHHDYASGSTADMSGHGNHGYRSVADPVSADGDPATFDGRNTRGRGVPVDHSGGPSRRLDPGPDAAGPAGRSPHNR